MTTAMQSKTTGDGAPLVLLGGGLTGWLSWDPHAERLTDSRRVVQLQQLVVQWGLEQKPLPADYAVATERQALAAALDRLGLTEPLDVAGWSYGGVVTLDFALDQPSRIRTLTLIEPPAYWVIRALGPLDDGTRRELAFLETLQGEISEAQLEEFISFAGFLPPGRSARDLPQWPSWSRHRRSLRCNVAILQQSDDLARLAAFPKPVLLVRGTGSPPFYDRIIGAMASRFPRATVVEMPAGHGPHIVSMERFLDTMAAFQADPGTP
jgi:pimeloyl-ACP methyl ester carboxylesterase